MEEEEEAQDKMRNSGVRDSHVSTNKRDASSGSWNSLIRACGEASGSISSMRSNRSLCLDLMHRIVMIPRLFWHEEGKGLSSTSSRLIVSRDIKILLSVGY